MLQQLYLHSLHLNGYGENHMNGIGMIVVINILVMQEMDVVRNGHVAVGKKRLTNVQN